MSPEREEFNILISAAGRRVVLVDLFRRALAGLGLRGRVLACDVSNLSSAFHSADAGFLVPACGSADFVPAVLQLCAQQQVRLVVPTIDAELPAYAHSRGQFEAQGTTVAVSSPETIAISANKAETHRWLLEQRFPTVRQCLPIDVLAAPDSWPYPLLVKPQGGNSSRGVAIVADENELRLRTRGGDFLVQAIASGEECTVDVFVDRGGVCRGAVPRRRLEVRAGEVSKGVTVRNPPLERLARRIAEALPGAFGVLNVQVFVGPDDQMAVVEINPRFGGGFPLTCEAGADYPRRLVEDVARLPPSDVEHWTSDLVMLRYDDAVFVPYSEAGG